MADKGSISTCIHVQCTYTGWWLGHPSEKYEFVNWDDEIPNIWENKIDVPNHQPEYIQYIQHGAGVYPVYNWVVSD